MKTPAMLVTPVFDAEASKRIVAQASKGLSEHRKRQLEKSAQLAAKVLRRN